MYIIIRGDEALVVDPNENDELVSLLHSAGVKHVHILLTHEHFDHISGVCWLQAHFNCSLICNRRLAEIVARERKGVPRLVAMVLMDQDRQDGGHRYEEFRQSFKPFTLKADVIYDTPCEFELLGLQFKCTQTPGHSPGSWCIELGKNVFTGDSLLRDDAVILRFPESNREDYYNITVPYLKSLSKQTMVLPGHGERFLMEESKFI